MNPQKIKQIIFFCLGILWFFPLGAEAVDIVQLPFCPQKKPTTIDRALVKKLATIKLGSANASQVEKLLGPPCSCLTINPPSAESWICQWKGDLSSNRLENMLNIQFEAGTITGITAVTKGGMTYIVEAAGRIQAFPMR